MGIDTQSEGGAAQVADDAPLRREQPSLVVLLSRHPSIIMGGVLIAIMIVVAALGPLFTVDPTAINPLSRLKAPTGESLFGTDNLGRDTFAEPSPLRHMWSLAIEEQFYVLWPLVLSLFAARLSRRRLGGWIVAGASASALLMALRYEPADPSRAYYFDFRFGNRLAPFLRSTLLRRVLCVRGGSAATRRISATA